MVAVLNPKCACRSFCLQYDDYLLKPIEFSRFLQAINKVYEKLFRIKKKDAEPVQDRSYFFNTDKKKIKVNADDILYIESLKDYVRIHAREKKIVTRLQIGEIDRFRDDKRFIRIHKSYMVNSEKDHGLQMPLKSRLAISCCLWAEPIRSL